MAQAIFVHDTRRIISVNEAGAALFHCDPVALVDHDMLDLLVGVEWKQLFVLRMYVLRNLGKHLHKPQEYDFLRCDGTVFCASVNTQKLNDDGEFESTVTYKYEVKIAHVD